VSARRLLAVVVLIAATAALVGAAGRSDAVRAARLDTLPYHIAAWSGRDAEPIDEASLRILAADEYLNRDYAGAGAIAPVNLYVAYYGRQRPGVSIHSPLHCLPGTGWEPLEVSTIDVTLADGAAGRMRRMLVRKNRDRALVLYTYAIHGRMLASEIESKAWLLHDSVRLGRSDAALVRIVVPIAPGGDAAAAEQRALGFARDTLPSLRHLWS